MILKLKVNNQEPRLSDLLTIQLALFIHNLVNNIQNQQIFQVYKYKVDPLQLTL